MSAVIKAEGLGKCYFLHQAAGRPSASLREDVIQGAVRFAKRIASPFKKEAIQSTREEFWALDDVSFEIHQGDRVGLIGRNGAGKSTLLKVLSRITEPTVGQVKLRGRVASLLEVGTGFHPELTGRENIFMNGALLGMSRTEIRQRFDEIVDFAEVEKFLDTPVKRYSSGMYVRLAFAVAAHLEPEILVVDEVLAVGDAQFQKKCLGKMEQVGKDGRTVLFVSHNMAAIDALCNKGLVLAQGKLVYEGGISQAMDLYHGLTPSTHLNVQDCTRRGGTGGVRLTSITPFTSNGEANGEVFSGEGISLLLEAEVLPEFQDNKRIVMGVGISSPDGQRLITCVSSWRDIELRTNGESLTVNCTLPSLPLVPGKYFVSASISCMGETLDYVENGACVNIRQKGTSYPEGRDSSHGLLELPYQYEMSLVSKT